MERGAAACAAAPMRTFSSTVRCGNTAEIWNERIMPRRAICAGLVPGDVARRCRRSGRASARGNCVSRLKQVVLPAPFGPISAWMLPRRTFRDTSWTATKPLNSLVRPARFEDDVVGHRAWILLGEYPQRRRQQVDFQPPRVLERDFPVGLDQQRLGRFDRHALCAHQSKARVAGVRAAQDLRHQLQDFPPADRPPPAAGPAGRRPAAPPGRRGSCRRRSCRSSPRSWRW